jgi:deoxyribose-phosphate aldolase
VIDDVHGHGQGIMAAVDAAMDRQTLASYLDHTLLKPEATAADVAALCAEANDLRVAAVCVSPSRLPIADGILHPDIGLAVVCGFPSGAHHPAVKAAEAARSVDDGATEVDMVIDLGRALDDDWAAVAAEVAEVRGAIDGRARLKVIIESAALDDAAIVAACRAAEAGGADYVKTSTGFHPAGGASIEAVRLMADTVGGRLGVKASGGIRTAADALAMVDAGATRIGCSASRAILDGLP